MNREVKRVPLDFNWPLDKIWRGYINPYEAQLSSCPVCEGTGNSPTFRKLYGLWYGHVPFQPENRGSASFLPGDEVIKRIARDKYGRAEPCVFDAIATRHFNILCQQLCDDFNHRWMHHLDERDVAALIQGHHLREFTHVRTVERKFRQKTPPYIPSPREVNEWSLETFGGHDAAAAWLVCRAETERLGATLECPDCAGTGNGQDQGGVALLAASWRPLDPPLGAGFQMWESVTEGSPISPVFEQAEDLATWMSEHFHLAGEEAL